MAKDNSVSATEQVTTFALEATGRLLADKFSGLAHFMSATNPKHVHSKLLDLSLDPSFVGLSPLTIIPIYFPEKRHYAMLAIDTSNDIPIVHYQDPLGIPAPKTIREQMDNYFGKASAGAYLFPDHQVKQQFNAIDCGPLGVFRNAQQLLTLLRDTGSTQSFKPEADPTGRIAQQARKDMNKLLNPRGYAGKDHREAERVLITQESDYLEGSYSKQVKQAEAAIASGTSNVSSLVADAAEKASHLVHYLLERDNNTTRASAIEEIYAKAEKLADLARVKTTQVVSKSSNSVEQQATTTQTPKNNIHVSANDRYGNLQTALLDLSLDELATLLTKNLGRSDYLNERSIHNYHPAISHMLTNQQSGASLTAGIDNDDLRQDLIHTLSREAMNDSVSYFDLMKQVNASEKQVVATSSKEAPSQQTATASSFTNEQMQAAAVVMATIATAITNAMLTTITAIANQLTQPKSSQTNSVRYPVTSQSCLTEAMKQSVQGDQTAQHTLTGGVFNRGLVR